MKDNYYNYSLLRTAVYQLANVLEQEAYIVDIDEDSLQYAGFQTFKAKKIGYVRKYKDGVAMAVVKAEHSILTDVARAVIFNDDTTYIDGNVYMEGYLPKALNKKKEMFPLINHKKKEIFRVGMYIYLEDDSKELKKITSKDNILKKPIIFANQLYSEDNGVLTSYVRYGEL
jgi:hypothetical protein